MRRKSRRQQRAEAVSGVHRDPVAAHDQQHEQQDHRHRADKAKLLADNGENVIVVLLRQKQEFLPALAKAQSPQPAGANGNETLGKLIALIRGICPRVQPVYNAGFVIADDK